jgi:hypothetical protein
MYKVSILRVFQYFLSLYHSFSIKVFLSFPFLISNKSLDSSDKGRLAPAVVYAFYALCDLHLCVIFMSSGV